MLNFRKKNDCVALNIKLFKIQKVNLNTGISYPNDLYIVPLKHSNAYQMDNFNNRHT